MEKHIIIDTLKELCNDAIRENEVPVAALIVENDKIISKAYNLVEKTHDFMNHAEIIAIKNAIALKKNWRLDKCTLYVTLEPCSMCREIIKKSRIKNVIYYSRQNEYNTEKEPEYLYNDNTYFSQVLSNFFKNKR